MNAALLAQADSDGVSLRQVLTIGSIVLTVALLIWSLSKGRRKSRLRPVFDIARVMIQVAAAVAVPLITAVSTTPAIILSAAVVGLIVGFLQSQTIEVSSEGSKIFVTRSVAGFVIWGGGLILMQGAGLANRTGLVELGQMITWFSIGITVGLIVGRTKKVDTALQAAAVAAALSLALGTIGSLAILTVDVQPAAAQNVQCPGPPNGYVSTGGSFQNCTYESQIDGSTVAVSNSGGPACGAELQEEWTSRGGAVGQTVNIKNEPPAGEGGFQRHLILTPTNVVAVASTSTFGGDAQNFYGAASQYASLNFAACPATPAPETTTAAPQTTAAPGDTAAPQPTDPPVDPQEGPAAPAPTAPPATQIITEDLDPNEVPESERIDDEGGELFPEDSPAVTDEGSDGERLGQGVLPDTDEGTFAAPEVDTDATGTDPPDSEDVSEAEALSSAIAGVLAAAAIGAITWAEAAAAVTDLLDSAGRSDVDADDLIERARQGLADDLEQGPPIDPADPANTIFRNPVDGVIQISDGTHAPVGHVWDPWSGRWRSPAEAAGDRAAATAPVFDAHGERLPVSDGSARFPDGQPVPPGWVQVDAGSGPTWVHPSELDEFRHGQRVDADNQRRLDDEWDAETERGRRESEQRNDRLAAERDAHEQGLDQQAAAERAARRERFDRLGRAARSSVTEAARLEHGSERSPFSHMVNDWTGSGRDRLSGALPEGWLEPSVEEAGPTFEELVEAGDPDAIALQELLERTAGREPTPEEFAEMEALAWNGQYRRGDANRVFTHGQYVADSMAWTGGIATNVGLRAAGMAAGIPPPVTGFAIGTGSNIDKGVGTAVLHGAVDAAGDYVGMRAGGSVANSSGMVQLGTGVVTNFTTGVTQDVAHQVIDKGTDRVDMDAALAAGAVNAATGVFFDATRLGAEAAAGSPGAPGSLAADADVPVATRTGDVDTPIAARAGDVDIDGPRLGAPDADAPVAGLRNADELELGDLPPNRVPEIDDGRVPASTDGGSSPVDSLPATGGRAAGPIDDVVAGQWTQRGTDGHGRIYDAHGNHLATSRPDGSFVTPDGTPIGKLEALDGVHPTGYTTPEGRTVVLDSRGNPSYLDDGHFRPADDIAPSPRTARNALTPEVRTRWNAAGAGPEGQLYGPRGEVVGRIDNDGQMWTLDGREITGHGQVRAGRHDSLRTADGDVHGSSPASPAPRAGTPDDDLAELVNNPAAQRARNADAEEALSARQRGQQADTTVTTPSETPGTPTTIHESPDTMVRSPDPAAPTPDTNISTPESQSGTATGVNDPIETTLRPPTAADDGATGTTPPSDAPTNLGASSPPEGGPVEALAARTPPQDPVDRAIYDQAQTVRNRRAATDRQLAELESLPAGSPEHQQRSAEIADYNAETNAIEGDLRRQMNGQQPVKTVEGDVYLPEAADRNHWWRESRTVDRLQRPLVPQDQEMNCVFASVATATGRDLAEVQGASLRELGIGARGQGVPVAKLGEVLERVGANPRRVDPSNLEGMNSPVVVAGPGHAMVVESTFRDADGVLRLRIYDPAAGVFTPTFAEATQLIDWGNSFHVE